MSAAPNVFVGDVPLNQKSERNKSTWSLYIDEYLLWDKHIDKIAKKVSSGIGAIRKLKSCGSLVITSNSTLVRAYICDETALIMFKNT
jgi:hypothetical protein